MPVLVFIFVMTVRYLFIL